jgi:LmbE family N-acetylglucosaminyl deacetylase
MNPKKKGSVVLAVAPHPDDETLGCGGTLLRHLEKGDEIHWLIATAMTKTTGYSDERIERRASEIKKVSAAYGFKSVIEMKFPTTTLDSLPLADMIGKFAEVFGKLSPEIVYLPFRGDPHSDHRIVFDAAAACTKSFRLPSVRRVLSYEALSETDFSSDPAYVFRPDVFIDISAQLDKKIEIMRFYEGELGQHPFPRSETAIRALASQRGAAAGFKAAEAFMLIKEIIS